MIDVISLQEHDDFSSELNKCNGIVLVDFVENNPVSQKRLRIDQKYIPETSSNGFLLNDFVCDAFLNKYGKLPVDYLTNIFKDNNNRDVEKFMSIHVFGIENANTPNRKLLNLRKSLEKEKKRNSNFEWDNNVPIHLPDISLDGLDNYGVFKLLQEIYTETLYRYSKDKPYETHYVSIIPIIIECVNNSYLASYIVVNSLDLNFLNSPHFYNVLNGFRSISLQNVSSILLEERTKEAIRAAKAAIMSRNMSHNLGSHIMYYLNLKLSSVGHILKGDVLRDLLYSAKQPFINSDNQLQISLDNGELINIEHKLNSIKDISLPFLLGLGKFINYLQERMDFIATVSTDYIPYFLTSSFKDAIYDEFNYDLRVHRHRDVISEFRNKQVENIVLDYIARSEGLARNDISIQFRNIDENEVISIFNGEETPVLNDFKTGNAYAAYKALNDIQVDLPGGQTGRQAFFSMLENIIRNAAKHGLKQTNNNKKLTITISLEDSKEHPDLYKCTIVDSFKSIPETANKINEIIRNGYIKPNGEMDENGKGIKEILISATWLRGLDNVQQENLQSILKADLTKNKHLCYTFYLLKPQKCALIISKDLYQEECSFSLKEVQKYGWNIYDESITENDFSNLRHKIIITDKSLGEEKNNILKKLSSSRILVYDIKRIKTLILSVKNAISSDNIKDYLEILYQQQYRNWLKNMKFELKSILIYDNKLNLIPEKKFKNIEVLKPNQDPSLDKPFILINSAINSTEELGKYTGMDIVFKSHFVKEDYDKAFFKNNFEYIESITGHNSTDRLIRHTKIDDLLFYQLNESAQTKVLLIDERFWSDYTGIDNDSIETFLNDCFISDDNMSPEEIIEEVENMIKEGKNPQIKIKVIEHFNLKDLPDEEKDFVFSKIKSCSSNRPLDMESAKKLSKIILKKKNSNNKSLKSLPQIAFPYLRKTYIYNIVETKRGSLIIPMDFDSESFFNGEIVCYKVNIENDISIIPCVYNKNERSLTATENKQEYNFHIMSVHQGILDKIYKRLIEQTDINKIKVTDSIQSFFIKEEHVNKPLIIHSGRSKPTKKDMPQEVPFIQFSSLKNALNDCKFTLTELLYGAKYKK